MRQGRGTIRQATAGGERDAVRARRQGHAHRCPIRPARDLGPEPCHAGRIGSHPDGLCLTMTGPVNLGQTLTYRDKLGDTGTYPLEPVHTTTDHARPGSTRRTGDVGNTGNGEPPKITEEYRAIPDPDRSSPSHRTRYHDTTEPGPRPRRTTE